MLKFQIISDSSCDLPSQLVAEQGIHVVPFYVSFDSEHYYKEGEELEVDEFYHQMIGNPKVFPKSSLPSVQNYVDAFEPYIAEGDAILCICITTKFSGSYNSACTARDIILEDYPDAVITVVDSMVNTCLQGLLVLECARMQNAGYSYDEVVAAANALKPSGRIFFTIGSIDYLKHGGRIGRLAGLAASTLGLRPLIQLKEGEIFSCGISRSRKKSLEKVLSHIADHFITIRDSAANYSLAIGYGKSIEEAYEFRSSLITALEGILTAEQIPIFRIGATIAVHTGPEAIGVGLVRRYDAPVCEASTIPGIGLLGPARALVTRTAYFAAHKATVTAQKASRTAHDVASKASQTAHDVVLKASQTAHDVALKASQTAHDVADFATQAAQDVNKIQTS